MKHRFTLVFIFTAIFCFAQTPKKVYMTREEVIALIRQMQPAPVDYSINFQDTDGDGVIDMFDREPNTPKDCPVNTRGESLDSDRDGVIDCDDKEPHSQPGMPVDPNGVVTRPVICIENSIYNFTIGYTFATLYFDENSYCLSGKMQADLRTVARFLSKNITICVAIEGYTDNKLDSDADNAALSYNRAKAVADFLFNNYGIAADRLKIKIKGKDDVIKTNFSEENIKSFNRRVEIYTVRCTEIPDEAPKNAEKAGKNCNK